MKSFEKKSELKFYQCSVCGNLIIKLEDSGITPQCCGRDMMLLAPHKEEAYEEKHIPVWRMDGCKLMVQVGAYLHPISAEHYIHWIVVKTNTGIYIRHFTPDESPEACFKFCKDEYVEDIYGYCNLHGLWRAEEEESI